ncbi:MAG: hypothetical protein QOC92_4132 [Acidimicrobiaceae bacterium]
MDARRGVLSSLLPSAGRRGGTGESKSAPYLLAPVGRICDKVSAIPTHPHTILCTDEWDFVYGVGSSGGLGTEIEGDSVPPSTWNTLPVTHDDAGEAR